MKYKNKLIFKRIQNTERYLKFIKLLEDYCKGVIQIVGSHWIVIFSFTLHDLE